MIYAASIESPVGDLYLAVLNEALVALFLGSHAKDHLKTYLKKTYPAEQVVFSETHLREVMIQLEEYFSGKRTAFEIAVGPVGTDFQKEVWLALQQIPYGKLISYGELAIKLNNPGGMRAVGAANGKNPIPIIIPCHRVIAADGSLGGWLSNVNYSIWNSRNIHRPFFDCFPIVLIFG